MPENGVFGDYACSGLEAEPLSKNGKST